MRTPKTFVALLAIVVLAALGLVACGGSDESEEGSGGMTAAETTGAADGAETEESETAEDGTIAVASPAADLRATLDRLLAEHGELAVFVMQKGLDGSPDFEAYANELAENTNDLGEAIGSVYGDEAKQQFLELWRNHIDFFVAYTQATAKGDEQGRQAALDRLAGYKVEFSNFLSNATGLPADALAEGLQMHVDQLTGALDAYEAGNYEEAYSTVRAAYAHLATVGDTLAGAIAEQKPDEFALEPATKGAADLRVTLGQLLGEHGSLAIFAMQKGYDGTEDFDAIAQALAGNTNDLGEAIGSVYGDEAKRQFLKMWRNHIDFFVAYTQATAKEDEQGRQAALDRLARYEVEFSNFLSNATGLPSEELARGLQMHVDQLTGALDAYAAADYAKAAELERAAYAHLWETGTALAGAIVEQSPDKFSP